MEVKTSLSNLLSRELSCSKKHPRHLESQIQQAAVTWFRLQYPGMLIAAVPNGGFRNAREAAIMRKEGVLAGFSDLVVIGEQNVLFVEMKTPKGRLSPLQSLFKRRVESLGFEYLVCHSLEEFVQSIRRWVKETSAI